MKGAFNIPAGVPFAKALAARLLEETAGQPETLAQYRVLLPTRRACLALRDAFLGLSDSPLLLPRLQPIGDVDEEELSLSLMGSEAGANIMDLPPAINPLRRRILLARLVEKTGRFAQSHEQAFRMADALGQLVDHVHTEGLDFSALGSLAPREYAAHWEITSEFLQILGREWPKILADEKAIDPADRRNRLLRALADFWRAQPPAYPLVAAGSTGSIPATANLLAVISQTGRVVLPGLDTEMDAESWQVLGDSHPQAGMKKLLERLGLAREKIAAWPSPDDRAAPRRALLREIMRPAETTEAWRAIPARAFEDALQGLRIVECENEREEAEVLALALREALDEPGKTAALITPDRELARRAAAACARWGIAIDDSAGRPLHQTPVGVFLRLCVNAAMGNFSPAAFLALVKHDCARLGFERAAARAFVSDLDRDLRGPRPAPGLGGLRSRARPSEFLDRAEAIFMPFLKIAQGAPPFGELLRAHIALAENLAARPGEAGADILWRGDDGAAAASFLSELAAQADAMPPLNLSDYAAALEALMKSVTARAAWGTHPRLMILGPSDARLAGADRVILAGLNEGTWPPEAGNDPWMSRPMRSDFGLPSLERDVGRAAHDFAQHFCGKDVILTRALKRDGAPAAPARWLQRLDAVLTAAGIDPENIRDRALTGWARALDDAGPAIRASRPAPRPPAEFRPNRISASRLETWAQNPYAIYARHVLRLIGLDPVEKDADARDKGNLLHAVLERFEKEKAQQKIMDPRERLSRLASEEIMRAPDAPALRAFARARLERVFDWLIGENRLDPAARVHAECEGRVVLPGPRGGFTITAKADRIEETAAGARIIDYKSGGTFKKTKLEKGGYPQLWAEALILSEGGFAGVAERKTAALAYWVLSGGWKAGEATETRNDINEVIETTRARLNMLVSVFAREDTPYLAHPRGKAPRFDDYAHLARAQEWSAAESEEAA